GSRHHFWPVVEQVLGAFNVGRDRAFGGNIPRARSAQWGAARQFRSVRKVSRFHHLLLSRLQVLFTCNITRPSSRMGTRTGWALVSPAGWVPFHEDGRTVLGKIRWSV